MAGSHVDLVQAHAEAADSLQVGQLRHRGRVDTHRGRCGDAVERRTLRREKGLWVGLLQQVGQIEGLRQARHQGGRQTADVQDTGLGGHPGLSVQSSFTPPWLTTVAQCLRSPDA